MPQLRRDLLRRGHAHPRARDGRRRQHHRVRLRERFVPRHEAEADREGGSEEGAKKQKVAEAAVDAAADAPVLPVKEEKVKLQQQSIQAAVKSATGAACDEAIAEFFYGCNIPPSVAARPPAVEEDGRHAEDRASDIQAARSESPWW